MNSYDIFWCFVVTIASAAPILFIKYYTETKNIGWIFASALCYLILILSYTILLVNKNIRTIYPILILMSVVLAGIVSFKNTLNSVSLVGILLGFVLIYILSLKV